MPRYNWWEEDEALRELRTQGPPTRTPDERLDALAREDAPTPTATPVPTRDAPEDDWFARPPTATPEPTPTAGTQAKTAARAVKDTAMTDPLALLRKASRDEGWEEDAIPFLAAVRDIEETDDYAAMGALVTKANTSNNEGLQRAVGKKLMFSVPFEALADEQKRFVTYVVSRGALVHARGEGTGEESEAEVREMLGVTQEELDAFRTNYLASDLSRGFDKFDRFHRKETTHHMSMFDIWAMATLPVGGGARMIAATTLGFSAYGAKLEEAIPGPDWVGKAGGLAAFVVATRGAALTGPRAEKWLMSWFAVVEPELIGTALNPDVPLDDRILSGVFAATPALGFFGPVLRNVVSKGRVEKVDVRMVERAVKEATEAGVTFEPVILGMTSVKDISTWRYSGHSAENAASIRQGGFIPERGGWMALTESRATGFGDTVLQVRPTRQLKLVRAESRAGLDISLEVERRYDARAETMKRAGEDPGTITIDEILRDVLKEQQFDGWVKGREGDIFVVDGRLIEVNGSPMPGTVGMAEWLGAGGGEVRSTGIAGARGLSDPPQFGLELKAGETPQARLAAAKAGADWLDTLNTWTQRKLGSERLAGKVYAGLANWLASGASKFLSEAHLAIQLYREGLQSGLVWSATQAAHVRNNVKAAFGDLRVGGTKEKGQYLETKLRDENWYRLDEIMEGRYDKLLTEVQEAVVRDWAARTEGIHQWALENGYEAGTWKGSPIYWPRRRTMEAMEAAGLRPAGGRRPGATTAGAKHREYELQRHGEEKAGAKYWTDLDALLTDHFNGKVQGVLDMQLKRWTDAFSETLQTRLLRQAADVYHAPREAGIRYRRAKRNVETDLKEVRAAIRGRIVRIQRDLTRAEKALARVRGRVSVRPSKRPTPKDSRDMSAAKVDIAAYKLELKKFRSRLAEVPSGQKYTENHPTVVAARTEVYAAVNARKVAMEHLVNAGAEHLVTDVPIMADRVFTWDSYLTVKKGLERPDIGQFGRSAVEMSALQRSMKAAFDDSSALLTQWGVAMSHPLAWSTIMAETARTMMKGGRYEQIMLDAQAVRSARYGLVQGANEMGRPGGARSGVIGVVERSPIVGHGLRASNFAFGATGDIARQMLWRLWHESYYKRWGEKGLYDLADHLNRLTGTVRAGAPIEAAFAFAPKFARAIMSMPVTMVRGGPKGHAARAYFLRLWSSATVLTVLFNELQGTPYNLDSRDYGKSERARDGRPEPYSVPVPGGGRVQLAGPFAPYLRTIFHATDGDFAYAAVRGGRGKLAPMPAVFADIGFREQYMGEKMPNPFTGEWADTIRYMAEQLTPFSVSQGAENVKLQMALSDDPWEIIRNTAPGLALEFFGARYSPDFVGSLVNKRGRELVEDVRAGRLSVSAEATGIIEEFGDEYKTWGEIPVDVQRELAAADDDLAKVLEIRKEQGLARENAYSKILELSTGQADDIKMYGEWMTAGKREDGEPYTEGEYIKDVQAATANMRVRMEELKKALGIKDELPDDAPAEARLLEEYITTVVEPALDYKDELDGEEYEKLYSEMALRHVDETIPLPDGGEMTMMERLDRMLSYKEDETYRKYREEMLELRPYWAFMDTAWSDDFIAAAELEYIQPSAPLAYETPAEFERFLVADLTREFMTNGLGEWGKVKTSQEKDALTFEERYGEQLIAGDNEIAEALAINMANRVMKDFYVQRAIARDSWLRTHERMLDLLMRWDVGSLGKSPPVNTLDIRAGNVEEKSTPRRKVLPGTVPRR